MFIVQALEQGLFLSLFYFRRQGGIIVVMSEIEKETAEHLRVLIQEVRVYNEAPTIDQFSKIIDTVDEAEKFLNRVS